MVLSFLVLLQGPQTCYREPDISCSTRGGVKREPGRRTIETMGNALALERELRRRDTIIDIPNENEKL